MTVNVKVDEELKFNIEGNKDICNGGETELTAKSLETGLSYTWTVTESGENRTVTGNKATFTQNASYKVIATKTGNVCKSEKEGQVQVLDAITLTGEDKKLCKDKNVDLSVSSTTSISEYKWILDGTEITNNKNTYTANKAGTYTVKAKSSGGCWSEPKNIVVTEYPNPEISVTAQDGICIGESVVFTLTSGNGDKKADKYYEKYTNNNGKVFTSGNTLKPNTTGSIDFKFYGENTTTGCISEVVSKSVIVSSEFQISVEGHDYICNGKTETLKGSGADEYTWVIDRVETTSSEHTFDKTTNYKLIGKKDNNYCTSETTGVIKMLDEVELSVEDKILCKGENVVISASYVCSESVEKYEWKKKDSDDVISTNSSFTVSEAVDYQVKAITRKGCESKYYDVKVTEVEKPTLLVTKDKEFLCPEGEVILTATSDATTIHWKTGSYPLSDGNTYKVTSVGTYTVTAENEYGCTKSENIKVEKSRDLDVKETHENVCDGKTGTVTLSSPSNMPFSVEWVGEIDEAKKTSKSREFSITSTLSAVLTDNETTCKKNFSVPVIVYSNPTGNIDSKTDICEGSSTIATALYSVTDTQGKKYSWDGGSETENNTLTIRDGEKHTLKVVTYPGGCTAESDVTLTVHPLPKIEVNAIDGICDGESVEFTLSSGEGDEKADKYYEKYTNINGAEIVSGSNLTPTTTGFIDFIFYGENATTGCRSVDVTKQVEVSEKFTISVVGHDYICLGETETLKGAGADEYTWVIEETETATSEYTFNETSDYKLIGKRNDNYCVAETTGHITLLGEVTLETKDDILCKGESVTLSAKGSEGVVRYEWKKKDSNVIIGTGSECTVSVAGDYQVKAITGNDCKSEDYNVAVTEVEKPTLEINGESFVCSDSTNVLTAVGASEKEPLSYEWDNGDKTAETSVSSAGSYTATVTDGNGCSFSKSVMITLRTPVLNIEGPDQFCTDSTMVLTGKGVVEYYWEGAIRDESNNNDKYSVTSDYVSDTREIKVIGYDDKGCKAKSSKTVKKRTVPTLTLDPITKFCENGESLAVPTPSVEMNKYVWDGKDQAAAGHTINEEREYKVVAYDTYNCPTLEYSTTGVQVDLPIVTIEGDDYLCDGMGGKTIEVKSETGETYRWSTGETTQSIEVTNSGTYKAWAYIGECESLPASFTVYISPKPDITIKEGRVSDFCHNVPDTLHAISSTAIKYDWDNGVSDADSLVSIIAGNHTVTVTDIKGCENSATVNMVEHWGPDGLEIEGEEKICEFDRAVLIAGCPECVRYVWNTGERSETIYAEESGDYIAVGYNAYGCPGDPVTHHLFVSPAPFVNIIGDTELLMDDQTTLTAEAEGSKPFKYYWTPTREKTESIEVKSDDIDLMRKYSVRVTDPYGCSGDASVIITKVAFKLVGNPNICEGETATMSVRGNDVESVVWSDGSTEMSAEFTEEGHYFVEATLKNGNVERLDFAIWIRPFPTVTIEGDESMCRGDSLLLTVKSDIELVSSMWNTGIDTSDIFVRDEGKYTVVGTTEYGCSSQAEKNIIVHELPDVKITGPTELIEEETIMLFAEGANTYNWTELGTTDIVVEIDEPGTYHLTGTDNNGCRNTTKHDVIFVPIPHPLINDMVAGHMIICDGDEYILIASGGETYTWDDGQTTDQIVVKESRVYTVNACLSNGQCRPQTFNVDVVPRPKMSMIEGDLMFCPDGNTTLTAKTNEEQPIDHFVWNTGEQSESVLADMVDKYSVSAVSIYGCISDTIEVETSNYDVPVLSFEGTTELCFGSNTVITVKGADRYSWVGQNNETERLTVTTAGTYIAEGWNEHECKSDAFINIQDLGTPSVQIVGDENICDGEQRSLSVVGDKFANTYYRWSNGEETENITVNDGGEYFVMVSNHAGCEARADFILTPRPNPVIDIDGKTDICLGYSTDLTVVLVSGNELKTYDWSDGSTNPTTTVNEPVDLSVKATDIYGCKSNIANTIITVRVPNPVTVSGDFDICRERLDTVTVIAECKDAVTYTWMNMNSGEIVSGTDSQNSFRTEGIYKVIATDIYSCESEYQFEVKGHDNPNIEITGAEIPVCNKEFATLSAVSDGEKMSYIWNNGVSGTSVFPNESGDYSVVGTDMYNCYSDASVHLIFNDIPAMTAEETYGYCPGESVTVTMVGADEYLWSNGETSPSATFSNQTPAFVIGKDRYGCEKRLDFDIIEFFVPQYLVSASPSTVLRTDPTINFKLTSADDISSAVIYWTMNDGGEMQGTEFDYTFDVTNQTRFSVAISLETIEGCHNDTVLSLETDLDIPNTITPNGDGINDHFMKGCHVEIKDRHGSLIHRGEDGWDGKLKNGDVTNDTYYYILTDADGKKYYGYVTVR